MTPDPEDSRLVNRTGGTGNFAMVDNNFIHETDTSLVLPVLDLSSIDSAILRFSSGFGYDESESIHVDVSTDGGGTWDLDPIWSFAGFNELPSRYVVDLSAIVGEPDAMLRFRFDSNGVNSGDFWQIDDIEVEVFEAGASVENLPGPATGPSPADGESGVLPDVSLAWTAGEQTDSHDVYFGTALPLGPGEFHGNHPGASYDPGPLAADTTYYWRIDEVNAEGGVRGCTWSFSTAPDSAEFIFSNGFEGGTDDS